jgi:3-hydroxyacyl-[acyl-carrier-protein] dehydratase
MSAGVWRIARSLPADHPALAGHFPGQPVVPGVLLLAEVLEAVHGLTPLAQRLGDRPRVENAKFLAPVLPGSAPVMALSLVLTERPAGLDFEVWHGQVLAARGQLRAGAVP